MSETNSTKIGRPRINAETVVVRLREGTLRNIQAALRGREKQSEFLRTAIDNELSRREGAVPRGTPRGRG